MSKPIARRVEELEATVAAQQAIIEAQQREITEVKDVQRMMATWINQLRQQPAMILDELMRQ